MPLPSLGLCAQGVLLNHPCFHDMSTSCVPLTLLLIMPAWQLQGCLLGIALSSKLQVPKQE